MAAVLAWAAASVAAALTKAILIKAILIKAILIKAILIKANLINKVMEAKMRLLLAEDEKSLSKAIVTILKKNNYTVDAAYDGVEALEYIELNRYDGIILDVMMPRLDGISVLQKIRKSGNYTPVMILTAKSEVDDKVEGLDSGANDYLTKPFAAKELLARIRAMTRNGCANSGGLQPDSKLKYGNITLDCASFELSSPFNSFTLANKEFQMIELMLRNPRQIFSAEQFMDKIWGFEANAESNVVWTYISYLRKKLTALKADVEIKARRNSGYYIEKIGEADD
jgi:DNA-binding response OmpR family regulator